MKRRNNYACLLLGALFLWGCNFSEECHYTGSVDVNTDWTQLIPGDSVPTADAGFYLIGGGVQRYEITGDTVLTGVSAGEQVVLLVSRAAEVLYSGMETAATAQARLPTYMEEGVTYTVQAPLLYADCRTIQVLPFETTACRFVPTPCIRQVNFTFHVIRQADAGEPLTLDGLLTGVDFQIYLASHQGVGSAATLQFSTTKETKDDFKKSIRVFGFCPDNRLTLRIQLSDGHQHKAMLSMDQLLGNVTTPVINCKIDVIISSLGTRLEIAEWEAGDWGEIELS